MNRPKTNYTLRIPERFSSLDDLHNQGFALESECEKLILEQPWVNMARSQGISQAKLGRLTGMSRQGVSKFFSGDSRPDILSALLICETLGISVEKGFCLAGDAIYSPCQLSGTSLVVNLRTLEVVKSTEMTNSDTYERLYYKIMRKKVNAGGE